MKYTFKYELFIKIACQLRAAKVEYQQVHLYLFYYFSQFFFNIQLMTSYCNIPREVVHKYVSMCKFCQKSHACFIPLNVMKKQKKQQKKNEMAFLTRCQVILFLFSFLSSLISIRNTLQSGKIITLQWLVHDIYSLKKTVRNV